MIISPISLLSAVTIFFYCACCGVSSLSFEKIPKTTKTKIPSKTPPKPKPKQPETNTNTNTIGSASQSWSADAGEAALRQVQFLASRASVSKLSTNDNVNSINERTTKQNNKYKVYDNNKNKYNDGTDSMFSSLAWRLDRARERRIQEKKIKKDIEMDMLTTPSTTKTNNNDEGGSSSVFNNRYNEYNRNNNINNDNNNNNNNNNNNDDNDSVLKQQQQLIQQQQQQLQQQQQQLLQTSSNSNFNKRQQKINSNTNRKVVTSSSDRNEQVWAALSNLDMDMNLLDNLAGQKPQLTVLELILLSLSVTAASASPWILGGQLAEVLPPTAAACKLCLFLHIWLCALWGREKSIEGRKQNLFLRSLLPSVHFCGFKINHNFFFSYHHLFSFPFYFIYFISACAILLFF
jgi:hypothetical protein